MKLKCVDYLGRDVFVDSCGYPVSIFVRQHGKQFALVLWCRSDVVIATSNSRELAEEYRAALSSELLGSISSGKTITMDKVEIVE